MEIAQENGISRQGVHDLIKRCDHILQEYEQKLHLIERFMNIKSKVSQLQESSQKEEMTREELLQEIKQFSHQILEEL